MELVRFRSSPIYVNLNVLFVWLFVITLSRVRIRGVMQVVKVAGL